MTIIQIGCNGGDDHVFEYCSRHKDEIKRIILVDANPICQKQIEERYKGLPYEWMNVAIVTNAEMAQATLFCPSNNVGSEHASLLESHMKAHEHQDLTPISVVCDRLNEAFWLWGVEKIDRLYIDVEGLDVPIVDSIDFSRVGIDFLQFEYIHSDGSHSWGGSKLNAILEKLWKLGYSIEKAGYDVIVRMQNQGGEQ